MKTFCLSDNLFSENFNLNFNGLVNLNQTSVWDPNCSVNS